MSSTHKSKTRPSSAARGGGKQIKSTKLSTKKISLVDGKLKPRKMLKEFDAEETKYGSLAPSKTD